MLGEIRHGAKVNKRVEASLWRACYEQGLPRLVLPLAARLEQWVAIWPCERREVTKRSAKGHNGLRSKASCVLNSSIMRQPDTQVNTVHIALNLEGSLLIGVRVKKLKKPLFFLLITFYNKLSYFVPCRNLSSFPQFFFLLYVIMVVTLGVKGLYYQLI